MSGRATTTRWPRVSGKGLKREAMQQVFTTVRQARSEILQWLTYYNSSLGHLSPVDLEQQHRAEHGLTLAA